MMTIYRKYTPTEIEAMADDLKQQQSDGILSEGTLDSFKFRGQEGNTWTVLPETGDWYCWKSGSWQPTEEPDRPLDGSVELLDLVTLPLSQLKEDKPEERESVQQDSDIRQMIERATGRIRDSYASGGINSAGAENLLKDLYLLDPVGVIWSFGMHSEEWYFFRRDDWELSNDEGPNPLDFQIDQSDTPQNCSNCGTPFKGGKFCSECGAPAPGPESPYSEAAREVVKHFSESGAAALPEQIVPEWKPGPGIPEMSPADVSAPSDPLVASLQHHWQLRFTKGVGSGKIFELGEHTRLGRNKANEIVLADEQCSQFHALIQWKENSYVLTDQNSTNGTIVNGDRIQSPTRLQLGDTITIGDTNLVVEEGEIYAATIVRKRPLQAQRSPGTDKPAPPDSPPRKRTRNVVLISLIVFTVTCLCCLTVGLGGYFL
ncbi:MAG: FHA domain-containing protein [Deltaproteobacteria bacterium]|nr:FHA domain-containing protein [Deltaproteobacteria bacterium]